MQLTPRAISLTFVGGASGTLLRWLLGDIFDMVTMLWVANILGTALLGFVNGDAWFNTENRKAFWAVGFCGGFTTMSGIALWQFYGTFSWLAIVVMFALGLLAYFVGLKLGSRMATK
ncbi:MAG: CrcB family protein [Rhodoluna sp.]|nr:CrcB family protein [Rhodoluna sp.]MBP6187044.1 CrcB family protein [Rhodoluna sp.]